MKYPLQYLSSGYVLVHPGDDCLLLAAALEETGYTEEHCLSLDFDPDFIARLMSAGFLVMSLFMKDLEEEQFYLLMPKHHLVRSCLFFPELHIKKSIRPKLSKYELVFNRDFDKILDKCVETHGAGWLTEPLVEAIRKIRGQDTMSAWPVSFALYREGKLMAGEFGVIVNNVYTSYSGYHEEDNAGTVQMILTALYLEEKGFAFWDLGMPLDYKLTLGAREITRKEFFQRFMTS